MCVFLKILSKLLFQCEQSNVILSVMVLCVFMIIIAAENLFQKVNYR